MIVLVLTNTILTTIMLFVVVPGMQDSNRIIKKVAQAVNLELDTREIDVSDVPLDECETFDLETKLTIALKKGSDGKDHYAVIYQPTARSGQDRSLQSTRYRHPVGRGLDPSVRLSRKRLFALRARAGHARPLPRGGPGTGARVNPAAFPYPHP